MSAIIIKINKMYFLCFSLKSMVIKDESVDNYGDMLIKDMTFCVLKLDLN